MKRSNFFVGVQPLTRDGVYWVTDAQKLHGPQNLSYSSLTLPGRDGEMALPMSHTVGAAEWVLSMVITGKDYDDFMTNKAYIESMFTPVHMAVVLREDIYSAGGVFTRSLEAQGFLTGVTVDTPWRSQTQGAEIEYTFRIPSGRWLENAVTATLNTTTGHYTYSALAGGSAPQYDFTLTIIPSSTNPQFSMASDQSNDATLSFWGDNTQAANKPLVIDSTYVNATQNGNNFSYLLEVGATQPHIPTTGQLWISTVSGISSITVQSRRAWY